MMVRNFIYLNDDQHLKFFNILECSHKDDEVIPADRGTKDNISSKTCHRNDGQSVCYCCTIFGYTVIPIYFTFMY